jgi:heat shock protein HspQ
MGTHIQDFATFSSKLKEMKSIKEEQEKSAKQEEYAQFFKKTLQKYGVSSPGELKNEEEKKAFFNEIDKGWDPGKGLTDTGKEVMNESKKIYNKIGETPDEDLVPVGSDAEGIGKVKSYKSLGKNKYEVIYTNGYKQLLSYDGYNWVEESMNESHFSVGDTVKCKASGMTGKVVSLDKDHGADDEKYYNVETEDGKIVKYAPNELVKESNISESEINSDEEFREYAETVLKNQHGEDYDQTKADEVINGLLSKKEGDDYGALIGMLNKG